LAAGLAAGALGTLALNVTTYLDIAVRGRAPSSLPQLEAGKLAESVGLPLSSPGDEETAEHRKSGIGALLGYAVGLGSGAAYGLVGPRLVGRPLPVAALVAGGMAMAAGDVPSIVRGSTDPTTWGLSGWLSDIVPHGVYGLVTAAAFDWVWRHR
jgi:hypothetical protein